MRSIVWVAAAAAGAGLAGLVALGGADRASAQGMWGESPRKIAKPAPRAKRYYYRGIASSKTCGQFKYWSMGKGRCLDARTSPPDLK